MADSCISKITLPSGTTYDIKDSYARSQIADIIAAGLEYEVVTTLPEASASTKGKIYLVAHSHGTNDIYDEFLTVQGGTASAPTYSWEKIGNTDIDLSNYVTNVTLNKKTATVLVSVAQNKKYIKATASGGSTAWDSKDAKTAVTGYASPTTDSVIGSNATFSVTQPTIALSSGTESGISYVESVSSTSTKKLVTTSLKGVAGTETVSKVDPATSQTTADGTWTAVSGTGANANLLANISVTGEVLSIGAATLDTQTTTQFTAQDKTVATADANTTTVATGTIAPYGHGSEVVTAITPTVKKLRASASGVAVDWDSKDSVTALTGLGTPSTASVIGASSTFTVAQPTVTIGVSETSGDVEVVTGFSSGSTTTALTTATSLTVTKS